MPHAPSTLVLLTTAPALAAQVGTLLRAGQDAPLTVQVLSDSQALAPLWSTTGVAAVLLDDDGAGFDVTGLLHGLGVQGVGASAPIIVLTAADDDTRLAGLLAAGAHEVLVKADLTARRLARAVVSARARCAPGQPSRPDRAFNLGELQGSDAQHKKQELLLRAQQRLELAEAAANAFIYEWALDTNAVERSQGLYRVLGYHPDELAEDIQAWQAMIHPDDFDAVNAAGWAAIGGPGSYALEYRLRHRDGHFLDVWDRGIVDRDTTGRPVRIVGITSDITALKQAQAALKELNDTLEQRVRQRTAELERSNNELDRFAYIASHDLKSPLRAIDHLATWITEDAAAVLPPASAEHLHKLRARVKRLEALLDDLLIYSRAGRRRHAPEDVDTSALVQGVLDLLSVPPGIVVVCAGTLPAVRSERPPLETVLRNLIENAVKHHHRPEQGRIVVSAQEIGDFVEFTVADDGPGIEPAYHQRVFDVFQTLRPRDELEGSGMGLAIVKKTVESAGGAVRLQSEPGRGAVFTFTWPRTPLA